MTKNQNKLNLNRVITLVEARTLSPQDYSNLKQLVALEKNEQNQKYNILPDDNHLLSQRLIFKLINKKYHNLSTIEQEIILANAILPDDKLIAQILSQHGFTIEHLKVILRFRALIKRALINNQNITNERKEQFEMYKNIINQLSEIFYNNFKISNPTIILNRICEMLTTCPELFKKNYKRKILY